MKKILWFCRTSDSSSLSTITDNVVPYLSKFTDITLLSNKTSTGVKNIVLGADTSTMSYSDYVNSFIGNIPIRSINMKYALVQICDILYSDNYDYLIICNGIYECDWFTKILKMNNSRYLTRKDGFFTKLIIWTPFDYIPGPEVLENAIKADKLITMNPIISTETGISMDWVGHGTEVYCGINKSQAIEYMNQLIKTRKILGDPINETDIVFLNANNYGPFDGREPLPNSNGTRKRLDITVKAFLELIKLTNKPVKLWIHTNLKAFFEMLFFEKISLPEFQNKIIISKNELTKKELSMIYKISFANIQTSTGEGWSLTNMESAAHRSLQIVPDFLACKFHFENRGILIPVTKKVIKNEREFDVVIGEVSIKDTTNKMLEALELKEHEKDLNKILDIAEEYAKSYTWKDIAEEMLRKLNF